VLSKARSKGVKSEGNRREEVKRGVRKRRGGGRREGVSGHVNIRKGGEDSRSREKGYFGQNARPQEKFRTSLRDGRRLGITGVTA